jgi:membrane associated rhomboid family serine protease
MAFIDNISRMWRMSAAHTRLIAVNALVFIAIMALQLAAALCNSGAIQSLLMQLECPDSFSALLLRPWSLLTYMFVHVDLFHVLFNMLWLYWFAEVFMLTGNSRQLLTLYIGGGIIGGILFTVGSAFTTAHPLANNLIGSSASVMAIVIATAILHPDYRWTMFFIGEVSLKWVAAITIVLALLGGGSIAAHIGGALTGCAFALLLRNGYDITARWRFNRPRRAHRDTTSADSISNEEELDMILDKVRRSGYASLSKSEKIRLIKVSRRTKEE